MCVCVFCSHLFWTSSSLDVPAGVTQEESHTGLLIRLPSVMRALTFLARRIQPFLSLFDREVYFLCTNDLIVPHLLGIYLFIFSEKNPVYWDSNSRPNVSEGYEVTSELPGHSVHMYAYSSSMYHSYKYIQTAVGNHTHTAERRRCQTRQKQGTRR